MLVSPRGTNWATGVKGKSKKNPNFKKGFDELLHVQRLQNVVYFHTPFPLLFKKEILLRNIWDKTCTMSISCMILFVCYL